MIKYPEYQIAVPRFNEENGFYTTKQRSDLMSKIKAQNTKPEQSLRKSLWSLGYRYRKNVKDLPGKPDIVINRYKIIIFIDGEFWHGFNWLAKKEKIKNNRCFWISKIERNMQRDASNNLLLSKKGYLVLRFWDKEVLKNKEECIKIIIEQIEKRTS
jgi:DNA mismatch endonuclease (patch repair protein)